MDDTLLILPYEELDMHVTPTPLSDPVFEAIFQDAEVSGLAMKSLLNATLEDSGDAPVGDVISVTPQRVHTGTGTRGYRIDVEAKTASGEIALFEVMLTPFVSTIERTLLYSEQSLGSYSKRGATLAEATSTMPRVIVVNILEKALRKSGGFHQVVELLYREAPYERATDRLEIHNLELSKFRKTDNIELSKPLHCWLTAICRSQDSKTSLEEVVRMDSQLQKFEEQDAGFAQFVKRYGYVAGTPEVRHAFRRWEYDQILNKLEEERIAAKHAAEIAESKAEGKAIGIAEHRMDTALNYLKHLGHNKSKKIQDSEMLALGIQSDVIEAARKQLKESQEQQKNSNRENPTPET